MTERTELILDDLEKISDFFDTFKAPLKDGHRYFFTPIKTSCYYEWHFVIDVKKHRHGIMRTNSRTKERDLFPIIFSDFERKHFDEVLYATMLDKMEKVILSWGFYKGRVLTEYKRLVEVEYPTVEDALRAFEV